MFDSGLLGGFGQPLTIPDFLVGLAKHQRLHAEDPVDVDEGCLQPGPTPQNPLPG